MKTFNELVGIADTLNSIKGLSDADKTNVCALLFDAFKQNKTLERENAELKAKIHKANAEVWR